MSKKFEAMAELYVKQIKALKITAGTDVILVFYGTDVQGRPVAPFRKSVIPALQTAATFQTELARKFAMTMLVGEICDNIREELRRLKGERSCQSPGDPRFPAVIRDVRLEVEDND